MVKPMLTTQKRAAPAREGVVVRLRVEFFDAVMYRRGIHTVADAAVEVGVSRATLFRWRRGDGARLDVAGRIAAACGVSLDSLFEIDRAA